MKNYKFYILIALVVIAFMFFALLKEDIIGLAILTMMLVIIISLILFLYNIEIKNEA